MLLSARLYCVPRRERRERIDRALARMELTDAADHLVGKYSGGMIRRLEIAQTLLHRPKVLFLDEPTVGLDPGAREAVWDHVLELRDRFRTTMIVTSHRMEEIEQYCDRIALINRGRIVAVGTPEDLKARAGPDATLNDVFIQLVGGNQEQEGARGYADARRTRRAAREHG
jgi:ABC-2 type transport system ATP-binding protein